MSSSPNPAQDDPGPEHDSEPGPALYHQTLEATEDANTIAEDPFTGSLSPDLSPPPALEYIAPPPAPVGAGTTADAAAAAAAKREKGRVRFNSNAAAMKPPVAKLAPPPRVPERRNTPSPRLRPSILRANSSGSVTTTNDLAIDLDAETEKAISAVAAQERAKQVAARVLRDSPPGSRASMESRAAISNSEGDLLASDNFMDNNNFPLHDLGQARARADCQSHTPENENEQATVKEEAYDLVRAHTRIFASGNASSSPADEEAVVGMSQVTPSDMNGGFYDGVYNVPPPQHYRGSVLSQLLKLYKPTDPGLQGAHHHSRNWSSSTVEVTTPPGLESGTITPTTPSRRKWYEHNRSQDTLANLVEASTRLANPNKQAPEPKGPGKKRPANKRRTSSGRLSAYRHKEEARITVHIAETLSRQGYIIRLCRALMLYGAPTHRLEEYLTMTARVLEIDGQFLYLPGCMLVSFDDRSTHTTEVRIVRATQGIDLGKLKDVHHIYKEVMHDVIGVDEGIRLLDELITSKDKFRAWARVIVFGLTSATCAPFSFSARLIDLPIAFCFGCLVGLLQLIVAPRSNMYSNVFEVTATIVVSFLARAFGSINGGELFCFSALAQSGIVMLLPGYSVLCSALELQSRAIVPGSIRIVYAIIYSLLLGFGITVGAALYGLFDNNATSATTCTNPIPSLYGFIFVPPFVLCISILYQAKWRQMPVMVLIAFAGYIVNFFSSLKFVASPQIANTLGALCVGILANLYSRVRHGVAAATLIPAIFAQVPGGLASTGGLLSGLSTANQLTNSSTVINGTSTVRFNEGEPLNTVVFNVAASMIQIAIGIAVGLFISAVVIYPLGKRRSGLFSF
ncbi:hypothetical protein QQS21_005155 [Conoideocrella luteorostrata]|uniref:DUF1212-domain-containing protein n=1 Tax=Conoideocrella luteorostrata TaxID=1105319 RepID=A0AAJ0CSI2_9HYPO|nr:hypothetical protein QQS21_005155 [Conoideocrella luteorostrata]